MTIKSIKEKYKDYRIRGNEKNMYTTYDYKDGNGKVVIVVNAHPHKDIGKYVEYIVDKVEVNCIKSIYIPKLFKNRIDLPIEIMSRITWCDIKANHYGDDGKENCPIEVLEQFAKTAKIMDASSFNFFRGASENREIIDLYDIKYIF